MLNYKQYELVSCPLCSSIMFVKNFKIETKISKSKKILTEFLDYNSDFLDYVCINKKCKWNKAK